MAEVSNGFSDVSETGDGGVLKKILIEGHGEARPKKGASVSVHYVGTFHGGEKDGEVFDSSRNKNEKFSFTLGEGQVIKAWDIGVATMKKGELCELICSPSYAYGDKATGSIPANSTLKFEVELFDWKGKDISPNKDGSLTQTIIVPGSGYESPKDCAPVKITIKGFYNDIVFDERNVDFEIGDCNSHNLIEGIEIAVKKMKKNEHSIFEISYEHGFGLEGSTAFNIPGKATVNYEITLNDFEKLKESYSIESNQEKLQYAETFKGRATEKFQNGKFAYAAKLYGKAVTFIEYEADFSEDEDKRARASLILSLRLNMALCFLKLGDFASAITESEKALEMDKLNEKGLYRLGQGLMMRGDFEDAKRCFKTLVNNAKEQNKQALAQIKICDARIKETLSQEKKLYQTMLSNLGKRGASSPGHQDPLQPGVPPPVKEAEPANGGDTLTCTTSSSL